MERIENNETPEQAVTLSQETQKCEDVNVDETTEAVQQVEATEAAEKIDGSEEEATEDTPTPVASSSDDSSEPNPDDGYKILDESDASDDEAVDKAFDECQHEGM